MRGTAPSSRSSTRPRARARTLRRSDVQLGWAAGSPGGTHAAVVEAVCSDRVIVAGELLLVDPASGEARAVDTHGVDVTWTAWRDDERLLAIGVRGLEPVALDVRRGRWRGRRDLGRLGILRREPLPVGLADRARAGRSRPSSRPGIAHRRSSLVDGESTVDAGRPRPRRHDGSPRDDGRPAPRALERARRPRDRGLPHARRGASRPSRRSCTSTAAPSGPSRTPRRATAPSR